MTIARILGNQPRTVFSCDCEALVRDAVALLAEHRIGALPIMRDGEVQGIFSERDLCYCLADEGRNVMLEPVRDVMTSPAVTVTPETTALAALSLMTRRRIRHLPVVDDGSLVGFISIGDLVKYRIDKIEAEADAMRDYIRHG